MRFVVFGAGGIGGVIGGRLAEHGYGVVLIGRGAQYAAIRETGLRVEAADHTVTLRIPIVKHPNEIQWTAEDVVLLAMKTQDTVPALADLAAVAPPDIPVVSAQNGVENERSALRLFANVYGICVMCPTNYVTPGVVQAWSSPISGMLDIGRYPAGSDSTTEAVAAAFRASTFASEPRPDIMRWKYGKLLMNLGNAAGAICGSEESSREITRLARREGVACLDAAGIAYVGREEEAARRGDLLQIGPVAGHTRQGGSSWQSLQRRTRSIEVDYLNGEIVLLGRLHGVATPVNALLQDLANRHAREGKPPGTMSPEEVMGLISKSL
jgi:2-dehydropantoate 2-reductase